MARLTGGLDAEGMPLACTIRLAGPSFVTSLLPGFGTNIVDRTFVSGLADEMPYTFPNYRLDYVVRPTPVPLGVWRAINYTQNAFYKEFFIDGECRRHRSLSVPAQASDQQPAQSRGALAERVRQFYKRGVGGILRANVRASAKDKNSWVGLAAND
jgi:hypothetical protein